MTSPGTLYGVGVGPGDPELLTLKAVRVLGSVDVVFAAASSKNEHSLSLKIARDHLRPETPVERMDFPMTRDELVLRKAWNLNADLAAHWLDQGKNAAFLTLGDPMTYSTFGYLLHTLAERGRDYPVQAVPGITSYQAAASRSLRVLAESGESLALVSGVGDEERLARLISASDNAVVLKAYRNIAAIKSAIRRLGLMDRALFLSRLGHGSEEIVCPLAEAPDKPSYFSLVLVTGPGTGK